MDSKPLRQEDYQAMAERCRVAELRLEKLLAKKSRKPINYKAIWRVALVLGIMLTIWAFTAVVVDYVYEARPPAPAVAPKRSTPCYFVRRDGHSRRDPWNEDWRIYRSDCSGCSNEEVADANDKIIWFQSREKAWKFIKNWNVEVCK